jgi:hypothetical protein
MKNILITIIMISAGNCLADVNSLFSDNVKYSRVSPNLYNYTTDQADCEKRANYVSWNEGWCYTSVEDTLVIKKMEYGTYVNITTWGTNRNMCGVSGIAESIDDTSFLLKDTLGGSECEVKVSIQGGTLNSTVVKGCQIYFCGPEATLNVSGFVH